MNHIHPSRQGPEQEERLRYFTERFAELEAVREATGVRGYEWRIALMGTVAWRPLKDEK